MKKLSLPVKISIGLVAGILLGVLLHSIVPEGLMQELVIVRLFEVGSSLFLNLFRMVVVPVVLVSMMRGVSAMNNPSLLGRVGIKTILIFIVTTALSSFMGIAAACLFKIGKGITITLPADSTVKLGGNLESMSKILSSIVPTNIFQSLTEANMLQVIFIAVIAGLALAHIQDQIPSIMRFLEELDMLNIKIVELILSVAPYGVFCLLAKTFSSFGIAVLFPLAKYILCVILVMAVLMFGIYPLMLLLMAKVSPRHFYRKFSSVMLLAFSTSSSNATLPSNIKCLTEQMGVEKSISTFILSLGATINMNGTAIMQGVAAVFIAQLYGVELSIAQMVQIIVMCLVASVGTAGMPGAGVIMLGLVLQSVGLPISGIALILGVDRIVDMFRTTVNITGDSVTTMIVGSSEKRFDRDLFNQ